jgi:hypothetical protein
MGVSKASPKDLEWLRPPTFDHTEVAELSSCQPNGGGRPHPIHGVASATTNIYIYIYIYIHKLRDIFQKNLLHYKIRKLGSGALQIFFTLKARLQFG